jgi:hypothetical protein
MAKVNLRIRWPTQSFTSISPDYTHDACSEVDLARPHPAPMITTRLRAGVAVGLTAFVFFLAIWFGSHAGHARSGWLLPLDFGLHGWSLIIPNVVFYGYLCWLGFWFVRGTEGRERAVVLGWFADILLSPLKTLRPDWAVTIGHIGTFGLAVALLAAVSLLSHPSAVADSADGTGTV